MAQKKPKVKWNQYAIEDDIKYRGPLNYRHFKIIGWALFVLKVLKGPIQLAANLAPGIQAALATPLTILDLITPLSVFFLLIASMSQLLVKGNYKKQMLVYGGGSLAIILVFELLYHRYIVGSVDAFMGNRLESLTLINALFSAANPTGFLTFNVFIDLFLCTSVMFFLYYTPEKRFQGDKIKYFRALALIPVIYEVVCLWLKLQANSGDFHMPLTLFPFLTAKPPMMFFVFCVLVIRQLFLEKRFCKDGRTHEEFEAYLETNRSTFQFAKFAAILCFVAGAIDMIIVLVAVIGELNASTGMLKTMTDEAQNVWFNNMVNKYCNAGFGGSADLLIFAPIMLLFNYRKTYKNTTVELAIPVAAMVVLVFIILEAGLFGIGMAANMLKEQVLPQLEETVGALMVGGEEGEEGEAELSDEDIEALIMMLTGEEGDEGIEEGAEEPQAEESSSEVSQEQEEAQAA